VKFSSPAMKLRKLLKTDESVKPAKIIGKTPKSIMAFTVLIVTLLAANGAFWYFRATHSKVNSGGEQTQDLKQWEVNLNENRLDEKKIKEEYSLPESDKKLEASQNQAKGNTRIEEEGTQKNQSNRVDATEREQLQQNVSDKSYGNTADIKTVPAANQLTLATMAMPAVGKITADYAVERLIYSKTLEQWNSHYGIDISAEEGSPVKAAMEGMVLEVRSSDPRLGVVVVIDHGGDIRTLYGNLSPNPIVQKGTRVKKGQVIGAVGKTAPFEIEDPPHLHFEVLKGGKNIDPQQYLPKIN
jgi:murein DD-endopeptidase MepM/ murein hydrolase activator NlpD